MGELWHHLDRSVPFEEARSEFGRKQRSRVERLAKQRLFGDLREQALLVVKNAWEASDQRNAIIHQGWLLRGVDAMRSWAEWAALQPEERPVYLEEWDRESKDSRDWLRVPPKSIDVLPVQSLEELRRIERALASTTQRASELTFSVASSRECGSPPGYKHPQTASEEPQKAPEEGP
jgi:hypothetical protein